MVEPVDTPRVNAALTQRGLRYTVDGQGAAHVVFSPERGGEPDLHLNVAVEGTVLAVCGRLATAYSGDQAALATSLINTFHADYRWPTGHLAWLRQGDPSFLVAAEVHMPVLFGATDEQLSEYLRLGFAAVNHLASAVHRALRAAQSAGPSALSPADLESWLQD